MTIILGVNGMFKILFTSAVFINVVEKKISLIKRKGSLCIIMCLKLSRLKAQSCALQLFFVIYRSVLVCNSLYSNQFNNFAQKIHYSSKHFTRKWYSPHVSLITPTATRAFSCSLDSGNTSCCTNEGTWNIS